MADLEETILKRNVPGRWSRHEFADSDRGDVEEPEESQAVDGQREERAEEDQLLNLARNLAYDDVPEPIRQSILAERMRNPSTGVKGVIADYRADQALALAQREAERDYRDAVLRRIAIGATSQVELSSGSDGLLADETPAGEVEHEDVFLKKLRLRRIQGVARLRTHRFEL